MGIEEVKKHVKGIGNIFSKYRKENSPNKRKEAYGTSKGLVHPKCSHNR